MGFIKKIQYDDYWESTGTGFTAFAISSTGTTAGFVFNQHKNDAISQIGVHFASITGTVWCVGRVVNINSTGQPTTGLVNSGAETLPFLASTGLKWYDLQSQANLSAGTNYAIRVDRVSGFTSASLNTNTSSDTAKNIPYNVTFTQPSTWAKLATTPAISAKYTNGDIVPFTAPFDTFNLLTVSSSSNPNEYGISFRPKFDGRILGLRASFRISAANADFALMLYENDILINSGIILGGQTASASSVQKTHLAFGSPSYCFNNKEYKCTIKPLTTASILLRNIYIKDSGILNSIFPDISGIMRSGGSNWTYNQNIINVAPIFDDVTFESSFVFGG